MPVGGMPPPSLWQLLFVLLVLIGVVVVPIGIVVWAVIEILDWLR